MKFILLKLAMKRIRSFLGAKCTHYKRHGDYGDYEDYYQEGIVPPPSRNSAETLGWEIPGKWAIKGNTVGGCGTKEVIQQYDLTS